MLAYLLATSILVTAPQPPAICVSKNGKLSVLKTASGSLKPMPGLQAERLLVTPTRAIVFSNGYLRVARSLKDIARARAIPLKGSVQSISWDDKLDLTVVSLERGGIAWIEGGRLVGTDQLCSLGDLGSLLMGGLAFDSSHRKAYWGLGGDLFEVYVDSERDLTGMTGWRRYFELFSRLAAVGNVGVSRGASQELCLLREITILNDRWLAGVASRINGSGWNSSFLMDRKSLKRTELDFDARHFSRFQRDGLLAAEIFNWSGPGDRTQVVIYDTIAKRVVRRLQGYELVGEISGPH